MKEIRKDHGLKKMRSKCLTFEDLFPHLAESAKANGVFGDRAPLQNSIQYADMTTGKRPPRPKPSAENVKEMKKQTCEAFKQGRCRWGEKCFRKHETKGESKGGN